VLPVYISKEAKIRAIDKHNSLFYSINIVHIKTQIKSSENTI